jgi:hypothetical protein
MWVSNAGPGRSYRVVEFGDLNRNGMYRSCVETARLYPFEPTFLLLLSNPLPRLNPWRLALIPNFCQDCVLQSCSRFVFVETRFQGLEAHYRKEMLVSPRSRPNNSS